MPFSRVAKLSFTHLCKCVHRRRVNVYTGRSPLPCEQNHYHSIFNSTSKNLSVTQVNRGRSFKKKKSVVGVGENSITSVYSLPDPGASFCLQVFGYCGHEPIKLFFGFGRTFSAFFPLFWLYGRVQAKVHVCL